MTNSLVSIIIPFYNTPLDYWFQCLDSLCRQTYNNIEIIVVDDGSKAEFAKKLDATSIRDSRLKIYHKPNGGVSEARNYALERCTGKFLCFVDSDDWVEPDFVETLVNTLQQSGKHLAACNWIAETGNPAHPDKACSNFATLSQVEAYKALICSTEIQGFLCNKIFEKNLVTQGLDESLCYCEDFVFNAFYLSAIDGMAFVDRQLYHYRQTGGNATGDFSFNNRIFTLISAYQKAEAIYNKHASEYQYLVRRNVLKTALNLRARMKYNNVTDKEKKIVINQTIREYKNVFLSNISIVDKINILFTWLFPVIMFRLKNKILKRKI